jgi:hypothetical protein
MKEKMNTNLDLRSEKNGHFQRFSTKLAEKVFYVFLLLEKNRGKGACGEPDLKKGLLPLLFPPRLVFLC